MNARYTCYFALMAVILLLNATQTVFASETEWQEVAPGAQLRLISSNRLSADGHVEAAMQLRMAPGLKTYWRVPGETGIPLVATWLGSSNVLKGSFDWPFPKRSLDYGVMDYVFEGDITVPLKLALIDNSQTAKLVAALNLGICSDICIPVRWTGRLDIDLQKASAGHAFRINAAYANVPAQDDRVHAPFSRIGYDAQSNRLVMARAADPLSNESLIVDLPKNTLLFDAPHSAPELGLMTVASLTDFDLSTLVDQQIRLTYDSAEGPFTKMVRVEGLSVVDGALIFE
ncbi:protein-disulfide reductase DsbD domain-containing protein [uncultured Maritalea sp.]|uniref:protein-disulfide reductase DsbD domain-containing protein n=1 Tax=uncultured Maritalea sp. TaxID=757249 RepID=UPI002602C4BC|nr:protein-disulfide reductase DsbD domain-containing protein [uncultured Maritalea sp.]